MNELELKSMWQTANDKLAEALIINQNNTTDISRIKVHSILGSMKPIKIFTLLVGLLWVGVGATALSGIYINAFSDANKFFLFSATLQVLLTAISIVIYVFQLIKIYEVEISDPIVQTQNRLAQLKISTLWSARIMLLQLPLWTTFWWNESMLANWSFLQWATVLAFTVSFTLIALWLFFNIKYENRNKKWFKLIFTGKEWTPLMKSMEMLEQLDEYKTA
jgi:hypothetical protein